MKKMSPGRIVLLVGAMLAYLIGSGFATGTEVMQYYSGYGIGGGLIVFVLGALICILSYNAFAYIGRTRGLSKLQDVFQYCAGNNKIIGIVLTAIPICFCFALFVVMISGGGATLNQQFGLNTYIGAALVALFSIFVSIFGLKKVVDVIGTIGPFVCGFALIIGIIGAFMLFPQLKEGLEAIKNGEYTINTISGSPVLAGLSWGGICVCLCAGFIAGLGNEYKEYRFKDLSLVMILSALFNAGTCLIVGLVHAANIANVHDVQIPNLVLASMIWQPLSYICAFSIICAIFSTAVPALWTVTNTFAKEGTKLYKILIVVLGVGCYLLATLAPYGVLLNWVFSIGGWVGLIIFVVAVVVWLRDRAKAKADGTQEAEQAPEA